MLLINTYIYIHKIVEKYTKYTANIHCEKLFSVIN